MFYIGSNVMNWPLEAQRALADGHEICVRESSHAGEYDVILITFWQILGPIDTVCTTQNISHST